MKFRLEEISDARIIMPFYSPMPTSVERDEEIRQQAIKDARRAFAGVSEMLKDKAQNSHEAIADSSSSRAA